MSLELKPFESLEELQSHKEAWTKLVAEGGNPSLFHSAQWLLPWWHAYQRALHAKPFVIAGFEGGQLKGLAPFYRRERRRAALRSVELRMIGDAGVRPTSLDLLVAPGSEAAFGNALAKFFMDHSKDWDVIDLQPLADPSRARAYFVNRMSAGGYRVDSALAGGAQRIDLSHGLADNSDDDPRVSAYTADAEQLRKGLSALRRLSRLEWAERDETSPIADGETRQLLEELALSESTRSKTRLARLDDTAGEAIATALVVDDGNKAVVLAMAVDPEHLGRGAGGRLLSAEAHAARKRGLHALDVVTGANDYIDTELVAAPKRAVHVRVFGASMSASLVRAYGALRRRVESAKDAPGAAAAGARATWTKIRSAAVEVAQFERMHLYRGELWTRGIRSTQGLSLSMVDATSFAGWDKLEQERWLEHLELDMSYFDALWGRGDISVFASLAGAPAGIAWCALKRAEVPELERELKLSPGEAYIHSLYVCPPARGRSVAASMLEFMSHELRQRDVYRSWALIGHDNTASIKTFEKAAYVAVCDVIHARMASVDKVVVRPPDPEAQSLLGLG